jgi:hypothetical protein
VFALAAEDLALESGDLMLSHGQSATQINNLMRAVSRRFIEAENA